MERITQLGYLGLKVSDLDGWERFGTAVLGLEAERGDGSSVRFRMDEYCQRFTLHAGDEDDLAYLGWEVADARALDALARQLEQAGIKVTEGTDQEAAERRVSRLIHFHDPSGLASEIYCGAQLAFERPFHSPRPISGFITGEQGLGHIVLCVDNAQDSLRFYRDLLGMRESDFIKFTRGGHELSMSFLHCNPRHHTLAFFEAPLPKRIHHFMLQVGELDDVGSTYALCQQLQVPIASTLGRHTNDHMVSFYMVGPSGFDIEYGWGARTIDDASWKVHTHTAPSIWGHDRSRGAR